MRNTASTTRRAARHRSGAGSRTPSRSRHVRVLGVAAVALLVGSTAASTGPLDSASAWGGSAVRPAATTTVGGAATVAAGDAARGSAAVTSAPAVALTGQAPLGDGSHVTAVAPTRVLSRTALGPGDTRRIELPAVPAGAEAAVLNLTVSGATAATTVAACGADVECSVASALPVPADRVTPGQVLAPIQDGTVTVRNERGDVTVQVDLTGYVHSPGDDGGDVVLPVEPRRVLSWQKVGARSAHTLTVPKVPDGATAVLLDLGYAAATTQGQVSACAGRTRVRECTRTSALNPDPEVNRSNAVLVPLGGPDGDEVLLYNHRGTVRLNADVQGFLVPAGSAPGGLTATAPETVVDTTLAQGESATVALPDVPDGAVGAQVHVEARDARGGAAVALCPGETVTASCGRTSVLNPFPGATVRALAHVGLGTGDVAAVTVASTSAPVTVTVRVLGYSVVAPEVVAAATGEPVRERATSRSDGTAADEPATRSGRSAESTDGSGAAAGSGDGGGSGSAGGSGSSAAGESSGRSASATPGRIKPGPATTGVPSGTTLKRHDGDLVITEDGTVLDGLDIHGFVSIRAKNVTIRNSVVRGSGPGSYSTGLVSCLDARCVGAVIEDTTIVPRTPSPWLTGILGHDYTARRVDVHHVVDGFGIFDTNDPRGPVDVVIESSWCHDLSYFAKDPQQSDGPSHNDCIQIQGGSNIRIVGNRLDSFMATKAGDQNYDARNRGAGLMVTPNVGPVTRVVMTHNWIDGGYASAAFSPGKHAPMNFGTFAHNRFGRNQFDHGKGSRYVIRVREGVTFAESLDSNVWEDNSGALAEGRDAGIRYDNG